MPWLGRFKGALVLGLGLALLSGEAVAEKGKPVRRPHATTARKAKAARARKPAPVHRRSDAVFPPKVEETPGYKYAQLSPEACYQELEARKLPVTRETTATPGLAAPTRITGPLHEVTFRTSFKGENGEPSVYSFIDCRLVLALDDFSSTLRELGIVEVLFSSAYRPPAKDWPVGRQGLRHSGGLAIDVHHWKTSEGTTLSVEKDFHGLLGAKVCGKNARPPVPASKSALLLRQLVCAAADSRLFQLILTPNYDRPHRNHFHLEVTPEVRWFIVS